MTIDLTADETTFLRVVLETHPWQGPPADLRRILAATDALIAKLTPPPPATEPAKEKPDAG